MKTPNKKLIFIILGSIPIFIVYIFLYQNQIIYKTKISVLDSNVQPPLHLREEPIPIPVKVDMKDFNNQANAVTKMVT